MIATAPLAEHVYGYAPDTGTSFTTILMLIGLVAAGIVLLVVAMAAAFRAPTVIVDNGGSGLFGGFLLAGLVIGVLFLTMAHGSGVT